MPKNGGPVPGFPCCPSLESVFWLMWWHVLGGNFTGQKELSDSPRRQLELWDEMVISEYFHWAEMGRIYPHDCILQIHDATLPEEVQGAGDIRQQLTAVGHISNWPERWLLLLATRKAKADQPSCGAYMLIGWPLSGIFTYPLQPTEPIVMFLKKQLNSYLTNPFPQV